MESMPYRKACTYSHQKNLTSLDALLDITWISEINQDYYAGFLLNTHHPKEGFTSLLFPQPLPAGCLQSDPTHDYGEFNRTIDNSTASSSASRFKTALADPALLR